jgi:hypothetical protein
MRSWAREDAALMITTIQGVSVSAAGPRRSACSCVCRAVFQIVKSVFVRTIRNRNPNLLIGVVKRMSKRGSIRYTPGHCDDPRPPHRTRPREAACTTLLLQLLHRRGAHPAPPERTPGHRAQVHSGVGCAQDDRQWPNPPSAMRGTCARAATGHGTSTPSTLVIIGSVAWTLLQTI